MFSCTTAQHIYCTNCTVCNWTVLTVITQKLLLYVQLHNTFTVQILYKLYSLQLNCTYSNYTEAAATCSAAQQHNTFIVQILYKYCTNCTVCNWTVLTVITQKPLLHVQLHNSTTHLLYKYCTKCTVCNWTVLTVITHKLPLYVQLPNSTENVSWCLLKWITAGCLIFYACINITALRNSYVCSCPVSAGWFIYLSVTMEWRHSGQWVDPASRERQRDKHLLIPSVWQRSALLCHMLCSMHSHWATPDAVSGVSRHCLHGKFQIAPMCVGGVRWGNWKGLLHWLGLVGP